MPVAHAEYLMGVASSAGVSYRVLKAYALRVYGLSYTQIGKHLPRVGAATLKHSGPGHLSPERVRQMLWQFANTVAEESRRFEWGQKGLSRRRGTGFRAMGTLRSIGHDLDTVETDVRTERRRKEATTAFDAAQEIPPYVWGSLCADCGEKVHVELKKEIARRLGHTRQVPAASPRRDRPKRR